MDITTHSTHDSIHDFETRQELNYILNCAQICQITNIFNQKSEISIWTQTFLINVLKP